MMLSVRSCFWLMCVLLWLVATSLLAQQVPVGFKVDLLCQTPDIEHPSAVTYDDSGNLYVGEDPMDMRGPSTDPIDRIVMFRWDAQSGRPVKTVFCENLSAVFGMFWHEDALYVMHAPYYTMLKDTDGDGIADVRIRLADSFGHAPGLFGLNNHIPSGMRLGLDGFVYVAVGDKGMPKAIGADGSSITLEGGGVFRMRPDACALEVVSRGVRNNMDVALDRFDNIFAFDNDDDLGWWTRIIHHVPTGYYGYPYDYRSRDNPYLPPAGEFGSGTACGGACYREAAWPAKYLDCAFFCDWGESKIEVYKMTKKGASFEAEVDDFMRGDGTGDFRPIDLCFSPDGKAMIVADWNYAGGGNSGKVGRLYRVSCVGNEVPPEPRRVKDHAPLEAQIRALGHPAHHERMRAQHRLVALGQEAVEPVTKLLQSDPRGLVKIHALWTQNDLIDELEGYDPTLEWIAALQDPDAEVRGQAARALGNRRVQRAHVELANLLTDTDAAVRMQAAVALGRVGNADSASQLFSALGEQDMVARFTMIQALRAIGNWQPALPHLRMSDQATRSAIMEALTGVFDSRAVAVLIQWYHDANETADRVAALHALAKVHRKSDPYTGGWWGGKPAAGKPIRPQQHAWMATSSIIETLEAGRQQDLPQVRRAAIDALQAIDPKAYGKQQEQITLTSRTRSEETNDVSEDERQQRLSALLPEESPEELPVQLEPAVYAQYAADHQGDPRRGRHLFARTDWIGCNRCHMVGGVGTATLGPDLLGVGAKYSRHDLIRSILEPSNQILIDYELVIVLTTDGLIHQGTIKSQTPEIIELVTLEGKVIRIKLNEIELKETSKLSPMPKGLENGMTLQNFADLIAYLENLKQPLPPKGTRAEGVTQ